MTKKERIAETIATIGVTLFFLSLAGLLAALFVSSAKGYSEEDVTYRDLMYKELTFERYERKSVNRNSYGLKIYFKEYETPFWIESVARREVDRTALNKLASAENKVVRVYFRQSTHRDYEYEICEMVSSSAMILGLSDYNEADRDNDRTGMILSAFICFLSLFTLWLLLFLTKFKKPLGELQLEHIADGNTIRVYGSRLVCSLVINDDIADQRVDSIRGNFVLKGEVERDGRAIPVEARFGRANILLCYDGAFAARKIIR